MNPEPMFHNRITIGAQVGGDVAFQATNPLIVRLRQVLDATCQNYYSTRVLEFAILLRIDGNVQRFGIEGCQRPKLKRRWIEVEIGVPEQWWTDGKFPDIVCKQIEEALRLSAFVLKRNKYEVNDQMLLKDFQRAQTLFIEQVQKDINAPEG